MSEFTGIPNGTTPFRPKARLIRLLGDELISDEVMAVIELVKNAYDADAHIVTVALSRSLEPEYAQIDIRDDGRGMDLDTVLYSWLEPATDYKRRGGRKKRTPLGRYPLGEKGVGRFAADKLGATLELVTRPQDLDEEVSVKVEWDLFSDGRYLDEVQNRWEIRSPTIFEAKTHGTLLHITGLRLAWDRVIVARLHEGLSRLVSPFSKLSDFRIVLECPDFPDYSGPVTNQLLEHAPYHLSGEVDGEGILRSTDREGEVIDLCRLAQERFLDSGRLRKPFCGPFKVSLFVWDLDSVGLRRSSMDRKIRQILKRSAGVSIYRDGFRIWPYGGPGDDWLELNQRRINNPTLRVSTNQIVGFIEITQEHNPDLRDRTSREGLIDTPALHDLKALILASLSRLEEDRFAIRQNMVNQLPASTETDPVLLIVGELRSRSQAGQGTAQLLDRIATTYRHRIKEYERNQEHLLRLSGLGLAAQEVGAEIDRTISIASTALRTALNIANQAIPPSQIMRPLKQLEGQVALLSDQLEAMESLYSNVQMDDSELIDVRSVMQQAASIFSSRIRLTGTKILLEAKSPLAVPMARAHLLQVFLHLFDNALYWLTRLPLGHHPKIHVLVVPESHRVLFCDNGPGIRPELREKLFQPFFTSKPDGHGLGLYIVSTILRTYRSSIGFLEPPILPGANFILQLNVANTVNSQSNPCK